MSQMKVPVLPLDGEAPISLARFSEDLLALLSNYDVAGFFQHPLIDQFAPGASQVRSLYFVDNIIDYFYIILTKVDRNRRKIITQK